MTRYHNTTNETTALHVYSDKAKKQDDRVLYYFRYCFYNTSVKELTPSEVWKVIGGDCPITSIRRAMSNLTNAGLLVKTEKKKVGIYGRNEYVWMLKQLK